MSGRPILSDHGGRGRCPRNSSKTLNTLSSYTNSQVAAVYLRNDNNSRFEHFASIGLDEQGRAAFSGDNLEGEFGAALASGRCPYQRYFRGFPICLLYRQREVHAEIITIPIVLGSSHRGGVAGRHWQYSPKAIDFIEKTVSTLSTRIEGILATARSKNFRKNWNTRIANWMLKNEMEEQSVELMHQNIELEMQKKS